jgi:hypothetical protein
MFCSSCGSAVPPGLSYCNRCGADLRAKEQDLTKSSGAARDSLVWALVAVTTVGLGAVIALMVIMKEILHFNTGLIMGFSLLTFMSFLSVDAVLIWKLLREKGPNADDVPQLQQSAIRELGPAQARTLTEPRPSVTDHTTRTLAPAEKRETASQRQ